jgi:hypothetical protein
VSEKTGETARDIADIAAIETSEELSGVYSGSLPRSFRQERSSNHLRRANKMNVLPNSRGAFYSSVNATVLVTVLQLNFIPRSCVRVHRISTFKYAYAVRFEARYPAFNSLQASTIVPSAGHCHNPPKQDMNSG